ncbi:hypothetical protein CYMTET_27829 [Cymbomonas tetramitiformis]|uniref:Integrase catalytic domain-containing protein n=1 Tax=Cymbomonas tetramitiformis TaxID=36881 RepID=A0AAE0FQL1_9CHLO|nr:hypothetical protein CYMTET_27829 [Cymbomonas tetramitiformis]
MGYSASKLRMTGGMSDEELAGVLGLAMDRRAMELLFSVAEASTTRLPRSEESQEIEQGSLSREVPRHTVHEDELCLEWLKTGGSVMIPKEDYQRVRKRAARHRWDELTGELYMVTIINGKELLDVKAVATQCETGQRVKTHYAREEAMLTPLEIKSFMYRWSLDLAWPTKRVTKAGNQRILIMTEHSTRFIVRVPIPNKEASTIASAFRNNVLSVFILPCGWRQCLIDRRVTSPDSPEGNGLTERVVRTIKFCFKKMTLDKGLDYEWDELLWSLVLSYNAAKQQSTGVAPFTLLFAQEATVPSDLRTRPELNFEEQEERTLAENLLQREVIVKKLMIHAGCSLEVAHQHRDTLLYEHRRSGSFEPKPHQFKMGDFVYIRQKPRSGMEVKDQYDCSAAIPSNQAPGMREVQEN